MVCLCCRCSLGVLLAIRRSICRNFQPVLHVPIQSALPVFRFFALYSRMMKSQHSFCCHKSSRNKNLSGNRRILLFQGVSLLWKRILFVCWVAAPGRRGRLKGKEVSSQNIFSIVTSFSLVF